ncbi:hypothetical protein [Frankia sp. QA3]|uniref:hypothetical protein n=1 Tax=Frankia sp. QA3 TaxID=710111 RepID=UPI000269C9B2|nr:hypothetical protein [Frankia sp. QA3]EIV94675.1 hypothetical protein FraQA3DRAFT_4452 [Frankia sp. QA3]
MSRPRTAGLVLVIQLGLHLAFAVSTPAVPVSGGGEPPGLPHAEHVGATGGGASSGVDLLPGGLAMAGAHLLAAVVLAWWLAAGERMVWRAARGAAVVARRVVRRLRRRVSPQRTVAGGCALPVFRPVWMRRPVLLRHVVVRRGPPGAVPA